MPRIRTIKPEFFRHHDLYLAEKKSKLPIRVAFSGLWCCADKEGRFKWKPTELKLDVLPYDEIDFNKVLDCLIANEFIIKYTINNSDYGFIPKFKEHQRITGTEKQYDSKLPEYNGNTLESHSDSKENIRISENLQSIDNHTAFQSTSMETTWIEGKEEGEKDKKERREGKESIDFVFWENEKKQFLASGDWIFKFCRDKDLQLEDFDKSAKIFLSDLELKEDYKDIKELKRHFTNWFNKKDKVVKSKNNYSQNGKPKNINDFV